MDNPGKSSAGQEGSHGKRLSFLYSSPKESGDKGDGKEERMEMPKELEPSREKEIALTIQKMKKDMKQTVEKAERYLKQKDFYSSDAVKQLKNHYDNYQEASNNTENLSKESEVSDLSNAYDALSTSSKNLTEGLEPFEKYFKLRQSIEDIKTKVVKLSSNLTDHQKQYIDEQQTSLDRALDLTREMFKKAQFGEAFNILQRYKLKFAGIANNLEWFLHEDVQKEMQQTRISSQQHNETIKNLSQKFEPDQIRYINRKRNDLINMSAQCVEMFKQLNFKKGCDILKKQESGLAEIVENLEWYMARDGKRQIKIINDKLIQFNDFLHQSVRQDQNLRPEQKSNFTSQLDNIDDAQNEAQKYINQCEFIKGFEILQQCDRNLKEIGNALHLYNDFADNLRSELLRRAADPKYAQLDSLGLVSHHLVDLYVLYTENSAFKKSLSRVLKTFGDGESPHSAVWKPLFWI
jgi:hypothetical protein